jgi:hypothetical protein
MGLGELFAAKHRVICDLEECSNWSWQRQDPWKYIDASSSPIENSIKSSGQNHTLFDTKGSFCKIEIIQHYR